MRTKVSSWRANTCVAESSEAGVDGSFSNASRSISSVGGDGGDGDAGRGLFDPCIPIAHADAVSATSEGSALGVVASCATLIAAVPSRAVRKKRSGWWCARSCAPLSPLIHTHTHARWHEGRGGDGGHRFERQRIHRTHGRLCASCARVPPHPLRLVPPSPPLRSPLLVISPCTGASPPSFEMLARPAERSLGGALRSGRRPRGLALDGRTAKTVGHELVERGARRSSAVPQRRSNASSSALLDPSPVPPNVTRSVQLIEISACSHRRAKQISRPLQQTSIRPIFSPPPRRRSGSARRRSDLCASYCRVHA